MKWITRLAYGVGQTQKDLIGSVLNVFAIIYFEKCLNIRSAEVGTLLLTGQVMNAISTPLIGYLSDRTVRANSDRLETDRKKQSKLARLLSRVTNFEPNLRLNTRKSWHLYGSILMTLSFPCIFGQPKRFAWFPLWAKLLINGGLLVAVQLGWAAVQIAHLTMLNYLTNDPSERVLLVSLRYVFSSIGDISTFVLSYVLLQGELGSSENGSANHGLPELNATVTEANWTVSGSSPSLINVTGLTETDSITIDDMPLFRNIALLLTMYGLVFVIAFQCGVPEHGATKTTNTELPEETDPTPLTDDAIHSVPEFIKSLDELHSISSQMHEVGRSRTNSCSGSVHHVIHYKPVSVARLPPAPAESAASPSPPPTSAFASDYAVSDSTFVWYDWFRQARFWVDCFIFTTIRLSVTLSSLYISPFLLRTLRLNKSSIMLVPLAIYCTSLVTNLLQHRVVKLLGRLGNSLIGITFTLSYCTIVFFYQPGQANPSMVYFAAVLLGVGSAFNNVCAIVVITDMIQPHQMGTAAFVHGFASLTDKIFTGLSVQLIQLSLHWIDYRHVEVFIVGGLLLIGGSLAVFDYLYWIRPPRLRRSTADGPCKSAAVRKTDVHVLDVLKTNGSISKPNGRV